MTFYSSSTVSQIWQGWTNTIASTMLYDTLTIPYNEMYCSSIEYYSPAEFLPQRELTLEEIRAREQQEIQNREAKERKEEETKEANKKAHTLLMSHLDIVSRWRYGKEKVLEIDSKLFNNIKYQMSCNSKSDKIKVIENGNKIGELCLLVNGDYEFPLEDVILTKMLHFQFNEKEAIKTSNHFGFEVSLKDRLNN